MHLEEANTETAQHQAPARGAVDAEQQALEAKPLLLARLPQARQAYCYRSPFPHAVAVMK